MLLEDLGRGLDSFSRVSSRVGRVRTLDMPGNLAHPESNQYSCIVFQLARPSR